MPGNGDGIDLLRIAAFHCTPSPFSRQQCLRPINHARERPFRIRGNWSAFLQTVNEERIAAATGSLRKLLAMESWTVSGFSTWAPAAACSAWRLSASERASFRSITIRSQSLAPRK